MEHAGESGVQLPVGIEMEELIVIKWKLQVFGGVAGNLVIRAFAKIEG